MLTSTSLTKQDLFIIMGIFNITTSQEPYVGATNMHKSAAKKGVVKKQFDKTVRVDVRVPSYDEARGWGALECQEGVSGLTKKKKKKKQRKKGLFHNRALFVRNVNRVSNSCKIGLKGNDFLEILRI